MKRFLDQVTKSTTRDRDIFWGTCFERSWYHGIVLTYEQVNRTSDFYYRFHILFLLYRRDVPMCRCVNSTDTAHLPVYVSTIPSYMYVQYKPLTVEKRDNEIPGCGMMRESGKLRIMRMMVENTFIPKNSNSQIIGMKIGITEIRMIFIATVAARCRLPLSIEYNDWLWSLTFTTSHI